MAIARGDLPPINPYEDAKAHMWLANNICMGLLKHAFTHNSFLVSGTRHLASILQLFVPVSGALEAINARGTGVTVSELRSKQVGLLLLVARRFAARLVALVHPDVAFASECQHIGDRSRADRHGPRPAIPSVIPLDRQVTLGQAATAPRRAANRRASARECLSGQDGVRGQR
jgi:hypothetical protein